jgi:hypothetical protein
MFFSLGCKHRAGVRLGPQITCNRRGSYPEFTHALFDDTKRQIRNDHIYVTMQPDEIAPPANGAQALHPLPGLP